MTNAVANRPDVMAALAEALAPHLTGQRAVTAYKHNASGSPITAGYSHGPGGNFSYPGVDMDIFHTVVGARGIIGMLPARPSVLTNPLYEVLTGVKADVGDEQDADCDNAPVAGLAKGGIITSVFGRYARSTPELEMTRIGQFNDRADPMDLTLVGSPIANAGIFGAGPGNPDAPADLLRNETARKFWELGVSLHRLLSLQLWQGNPANSNPAGYQEMTGLDLLINTGYVDAIAGISLPAINSQLVNFNYQSVQDNGSTLVEAMSYQYHYLKDLAFRTGVSPVNWVIAMRPELFYEVTAVWPCAYLTYRCNLSGNDTQFVQASEQVRLRDEMRAGQYLMIDGERVPVVLDDGIALLDGNSSGGHFPAGCFASDIYFVPLSIVGGRSVTYMEYMDFENPSLRQLMAQTNLALARVEGPWLTVPRQTNTCIAWQSVAMPRVVMRTPWLAAKVQNVVYCPTINFRQPFPSDPYFINGGVTERTGPSYFSLWQN